MENKDQLLDEILSIGEEEVACKKKIQIDIGQLVEIKIRDRRARETLARGIMNQDDPDPLEGSVVEKESITIKEYTAAALGMFFRK